MNSDELNEYKKKFKESHKLPIRKCIRKRVEASTGNRTSDRKSVGNVSWIDYYRAFTNPDCEVFNCAACGAKISSNPTIVKDHDDMMEAEGGHILFVGRNLGYYIVPLCPICNNPSKEWVALSVGSVAVEEVDAVIQHDEN